MCYGCWEFVCCVCWEFLWCLVGVGSFGGVLWLLGVSVLWEFVCCVVAVGVCVVCGEHWEFLWCVVGVEGSLSLQNFVQILHLFLPYAF